MVVEAQILRSDLVAMNVALFFRLRANIVILLFLFVLVGAPGRDLVARSIPRYLTVTIIGSVFVAAVLFAAGVLLQTVVATEKQGFLGHHRFQISSDGFSEEAKGTRTITRWDCISRIFILKRYIDVTISAYRVHIIPKRAFKFESEFTAFARELKRHIGVGEKNNQDATRHRDS